MVKRFLWGGILLLVLSAGNIFASASPEVVGAIVDGIGKIGGTLSDHITDYNKDSKAGKILGSVSDGLQGAAAKSQGREYENHHSGSSNSDTSAGETDNEKLQEPKKSYEITFLNNSLYPVTISGNFYKNVLRPGQADTIQTEYLWINASSYNYEYDENYIVVEVDEKDTEYEIDKNWVVGSNDPKKPKIHTYTISFQDRRDVCGYYLIEENTIINNTGVSIQGAYIVEYGSQDWGNNLLKGSSFPAGYELPVELKGGETYAAALVDYSGRIYIKEDIYAEPEGIIEFTPDDVYYPE